MDAISRMRSDMANSVPPRTHVSNFRRYAKFGKFARHIREQTPWAPAGD
jgi:hypothetical protein